MDRLDSRDSLMGGRTNGCMLYKRATRDKKSTMWIPRHCIPSSMKRAAIRWDISRSSSGISSTYLRYQAGKSEDLATARVLPSHLGVPHGRKIDVSSLSNGNSRNPARVTTLNGLGGGRTVRLNLKRPWKRATKSARSTKSITGGKRHGSTPTRRLAVCLLRTSTSS